MIAPIKDYTIIPNTLFAFSLHDSILKIRRSVARIVRNQIPEMKGQPILTTLQVKRSNFWKNKHTWL